MKTVANAKTRSQNFKMITIGGQLRKLTVGMRVSEYLSSEIPKGIENLNMYTRYIKVVSIGLLNSANEMPENYTEDLIAEWIDEMEQPEWEGTKQFIDEALGFIVGDYVMALERLTNNLTANLPA